MSIDVTGETPAESAEHVQAIDRFKRTQDLLFEQTAIWVENPNNRTGQPVEDTVDIANIAFRQAIETTVAASEEEISLQDKKATLISLYYGTDLKRVQYFQELMPQAAFRSCPDNAEVLEAFMDAEFELGRKHKIVETFVTGYRGALEKDYENMADALGNTEQGRRAKSLQTAKKKAGEIGTIAAGVTVGGIAFAIIKQGYEASRR